MATEACTTSLHSLDDEIFYVNNIKSYPQVANLYLLNSDLMIKINKASIRVPDRTINKTRDG